MHGYEDLTVVSDSEFEVLALLPDFVRKGDCLTTPKDGDSLYVVVSQSWWDKYQRACDEVNTESEQLTSLAAELDALSEQEIKPQAAPTRTKDQELFDKFFPAV